MSIPGHTPGQMAIRVRSRGEEALFAGDIAHQPIQVAMPDWSSKYCADPKQSAASRRRISTTAQTRLVCCCRSISAGPIAAASRAVAMILSICRTIASRKTAGHQ